MSERFLKDSRAKDKDKLAGRFRKRPSSINNMIKVYNVLCNACKVHVKLCVERGEVVNITDFCEDCQGKVMPIIGKIKEKLEK